MFSNLIITATAISMVAQAVLTPTPDLKLFSTREFSLKERYSNSYVSNVFSDNILLTAAYLRGIVKGGSEVNWEEIRKPFTYSFTLQPGESFAFHDGLFTEYEGKVKLTTNAHFNAQEGFKSDGYLIGDGVCHFASLIYWAAKDAGLNALAPVNHNFAAIPQVPSEYGVSIYSHGKDDKAGASQNLYIKNNKDKAINFVFEFDGTNLKVSVEEAV